MAQLPELLSSDPIYNGKVFDIRIDEIREGDVQYKREIVVHKGSAVVIPVFNDGTAALVRQYRHAAGTHLLEVCAGTLNAGEDPETGARRELEEEIGVTAEQMEKLSEFYVSPGFLTEKMHLYLATGLTEARQMLEDDEILTVERHPLEDLLEMTRRGDIHDAKTIIAVQFAAAISGNRGVK
jgi:ADP-ribose pyrophosphatase